MLPPQVGPRTWVHRVFSCLCPIPPERHRRLVPQNFSIFDGYVVDATTTFGAHRGAHGERILFSAGPLFIDIFIAAVAPTIFTREFGGCASPWISCSVLRVHITLVGPCTHSLDPDMGRRFWDRSWRVDSGSRSTPPTPSSPPRRTSSTRVL